MNASILKSTCLTICLLLTLGTFLAAPTHGQDLAWRGAATNATNATKSNDQLMWSLRAHWSFDDCPGGVVPDLTGRGYDAVLQDGAQCTTKNGYHVGYFDGVADAAQAQNSTGLNFGNEMTVSAWVKPSATNGLRTIVGKWYAPNSFLLSMELGRYRFSVVFENGAQYVVEANVPGTGWTHVTGVLTPWSSNRQIRLYVNGQNVANTSVPEGLALRTSSRPIVLGNHPSTNDFHGYLDHVSLYDRALPDSDIAQLASKHQVRWRWTSGHGIGSQRQFLADVSGDGRADAIVYFGATGSWYVAKAKTSNNGFASYSQWDSGFGIGSNEQLVADVNGDGRDDAIVYFGDTGRWYVALSSGGGFNAFSQWDSGNGIGSSRQLLADVNGDGRADAVVFFIENGAWYVAPSTGSSFGSFSLWSIEHGIGSNRQFLADVTGDGRADALVFFAPSGAWYSASSTGVSFSQFTLWAAGHGIGSNQQLMADVTGDGRADALVYFNANAYWWVATSNGSAFNPFHLQVSGQGFGSSQRFAADVDKDGRADPVVFHADSGKWYTVISH